MPIRLLSLVIALALLTGCATPSPEPQRTPILKPTGRSEFMVRIHTVEASDIDPVCKQLGARAWPGMMVNGCSRFDELVNRLTMWVIEPEYLEDRAFCTVGHELWHGVRGAFHK